MVQRIKINLHINTIRRKHISGQPKNIRMREDKTLLDSTDEPQGQTKRKRVKRRRGNE